MARAKSSRFSRSAVLVHLQTRTRTRIPLGLFLKIAKTRHLWALAQAGAAPRSAEARQMTSGTYRTKDLTNFRLRHLLLVIIRARILLRLRTSCPASITEEQLWLPPFAVRAPAIVGAIPFIPPATQPRMDPGTPMMTLVLPLEPSWIEMVGTRLAETETETGTATEAETRTDTEQEGVGPLYPNLARVSSQNKLVYLVS